MAEDTYPMTAEGRDKLKKELEDLKVNQRPKVVERIKIARSYGDLSETQNMSQLRTSKVCLKAELQRLSICCSTPKSLIQKQVTRTR